MQVLLLLLLVGRGQVVGKWSWLVAITCGKHCTFGLPLVGALVGEGARRADHRGAGGRAGEAKLGLLIAVGLLFLAPLRRSGWPRLLLVGRLDHSEKLQLTSARRAAAAAARSPPSGRSAAPRRPGGGLLGLQWAVSVALLVLLLVLLAQDGADAELERLLALGDLGVVAARAQTGALRAGDSPRGAHLVRGWLLLPLLLVVVVPRALFAARLPEEAHAERVQRAARLLALPVGGARRARCGRGCCSGRLNQVLLLQRQQQRTVGSRALRPAHQRAGPLGRKLRVGRPARLHAEKAERVHQPQVVARQQVAQVVSVQLVQLVQLV